MAMKMCQALVEAASVRCEDAQQRQHELVNALVASTHEAAESKARLEAWKEGAATEIQLRQELAEARINNAQLVARLHLAEEKLELAARLHQAQIEIAALKDEVAAAKTARGESRKRVPQVAEWHNVAPR
jgi:hypothetical protein